MTRTHSPRSRPPTRLAFHLSRIVIDLGVLLVLGAMSLPFVSAEGWGQRAVAADALPALLLVLPIFVITLLPDQSHPLPAPLGWISLFLAATALPYSVIKYLDASTLANTLGGSVGMGARLLVLGAFVTLAGLVLGLVRRLLGLPVGGAYPGDASGAARPPAGKHPVTLSPETGGTGPTPAAGHSPSAADVPAAGPASSPETPPRPAAPPPRPARAPARPAPADPDTEPTLPGLKQTRRWWPDDLEDLFS